MTTLDQWAAMAARELGQEPPSGAAQRLVLDVAREAAHNVLRPGAPLATYLVGLAVGQGASLDEAAAAMIDLARRSAPPPAPSDPPAPSAPSAPPAPPAPSAPSDPT